MFEDIKVYMEKCHLNVNNRRLTLGKQILCNICKTVVNKESSHKNHAHKTHGCLNIARLRDYLMTTKQLGPSELPFNLQPITTFNLYIKTLL